MSKHTPGPWVATCRHMSYKGGDWPEDEFLQWEVEGPRVPWGRGEFYQADARLIAAAPELLDALKVMLENGADYTATRDQARAAIAKAEGRDE